MSTKIDQSKPPKGWRWALRVARPPAEVGMVASSTHVVREEDSSGLDSLNGIPLAEAHRIAREEAQPYVAEALERLAAWLEHDEYTGESIGETRDSRAIRSIARGERPLP